MTDEHLACLIIEVIELPLKNLKQQLTQLESEGLRMDAKLWSLAEGLALQELPAIKSTHGTRVRRRHLISYETHTLYSYLPRTRLGRHQL